MQKQKKTNHKNHKNEKPGKKDQRSTTREWEETLTILTWDLEENAAESVAPLIDEIFPEGYEIVDGSTLERPRPGRILFRFYVSCAETEGKVKLLNDLALRSAHLLKEGGQIEVKPLADRDWSEETRKSFPPLEIGSFLFLPSWEAEKLDDNRTKSISPDKALHIIELEPGAAFGTGHHPTTRLCLRALEYIDSEVRTGTLAKPSKILDLGCGSGILGLAAASLWNGRITAVDIDPDALESARENTARNNLTDRFSFAVGTESLENETFDLVIANIRASVLMDLAWKFNNWVKPESAVILSGILVQEKESFLATWSDNAPGFVKMGDFEEKEHQPEESSKSEPEGPNKWICLVMRQKT